MGWAKPASRLSKDIGTILLDAARYSTLSRYIYAVTLSPTVGPPLVCFELF